MQRNYKIGPLHKKLRWFQIQVIKAFYACRFLTLVVARQHGKTELGAIIVQDFVFRYKKRKNPKATIVMKTAEQAFDVYFQRIHDRLKHLPKSMYIVQKSQSGLTRVTLHRPWLEDYVTLTFAGTGNAESLRGRTNDLVVIDEAASQQAKVWFDILQETLSDTKGKALITGTNQGRTWFYKLQKTHEKLQAAGFNLVANLDYDNIGAMLQDDAYIYEKEILAKAAGKWAEYLRECKNDPDAIDLEESPFSMLISEKKRGVVTEIDKRLIRHLNIMIDVGKPGNNAAWFFYIKNKAPVFVNYQDELNQFQLIDYALKNYPNSFINLMYPSDVETPTTLDGKTNLESIEEYVGSNRRITIEVLSQRTNSKKQFLMRAVELLQKSVMEINNCLEGLDKLSGVRLRKDPKTEYVSYGDLVRNGSQHCADSFGYCAVAIDNDYISDGPAHQTEIAPTHMISKYPTNSRFKY